MRTSNWKTMAAMVLGWALFAALLLPQPNAAAQASDGWAVLSPIVLGERQTYFGIEMDPASGLLHVTNTSTRQIDVFEPSGAHVLSYGDTQYEYPADVAFMGDSIYVTYFTSGIVASYDRSTFAKQQSVAVGGKPVGLDAADGEVYVAVRDSRPDGTGGQSIEVLGPDLDFVRESFIGNSCLRPNDVVAIGDTLVVVYIQRDGPTCTEAGIASISRSIGLEGSYTLVSRSVLDTVIDGAYTAASGPNGEVYVKTIDGVSVAGGDQVAAFGIDIRPTGMTVDPSGRTMWILHRGAPNGMIVPITLERCFGQVPTHVGSVGNDTFDQVTGDATVWTGAGIDVVLTGDGNDAVCTGAGDDIVVTGDGSDRIDGGDGDDRLGGERGVDTIRGGLGDDRIGGGGGSDHIYGDDGNDIISAGSGGDRVYGGPGDDTIYGQGGRDFLWGEYGNDTIQGDAASDHIWGGPGEDTLSGNGGPDKLYGGPGNDGLLGGGNTDYLDGGEGIDTADGQGGADNPVVQDVSGCIAETLISC